MGSATVQPTRGNTQARSSRSTVTIRDVQMTGPSMSAIRFACREVVETEAEGGMETGGQQPTGRRNLTPAGRKKISDTAKARHARKKAAGQATTSTEQPQATAKKANHQKAMPAAG